MSLFLGMLLAIDPGADCGWATFRRHPATKGQPGRGTLVAAGLGAANLVGHPKSPKATTVPPAPSEVEEVVCERPKLYPNGKARPADVITLAIRAGEAVGPYRAAGATVTYHEPWAWKGSIDKDIHHARIWARLTATEQSVVSEAARGVAPSKRHNMMDAVALGLFAVGRVGVAGV